jgi:tetratricopeptide (TPR) repeat protein
MSDVPEPIHAALLARGASPPLGSLRTAGKWPLGPMGATQRLESLWVVVTTQRVWVVAADADDSYAVATGDRGGLRLERGWVTDTLHAGRFALPVRTGTRRAATELVELWTTLPGRGDAVEVDALPLPAERGRASRAAVGVPDWAVAEVPAPTGSSWLFGLETASSHAFGRYNGSPASASIWLLVSDQAACFAARVNEDTLAVEPLAGPLQERSTSTRSWLTDGATEVAGPLWSSGERGLATKLAAGDAQRRWAVLAEHHAEQGDAEGAVKAWRGALSRDLCRDSWPGIARFAWTVSDNRRAQAALSYTLHEGILELRDRRAWRDPVERRERALRRHHAAAAEFARTIGPTIDALEMPAPPRMLPSPPADENELWVHALGALGRWTDAAAAARALDEGPRAMEIMAAVREMGGSRDAAAAWRHAADAWSSADEAESALRCLERAVAIGGSAVDHWRLGVWHWQAHQHASARRRWAEAVGMDADGAAIPDVVLDADGWRAIAALAEGDGARGAAKSAWLHALTAAPTDLHAARSAARLHDGDPADASVWLAEAAEAAERLENASGPEVAATWVDVASRREGADRIAALTRALQVDVLHPRTWEAVLPLAEGHDVYARWAHVAAIVGGDAFEPVPAPAASLPDDFDSLAPAGAGWMERLRAVLDDNEPPTAQALVRGLDRLDRVSSDAATVVQEVAHTLRLPPPEMRCYRGDNALGIAAHASEPMVVLVGADHLEGGPAGLSLAELRYAVAVELAHIAAGHPALDQPGGVLGTSQSAYNAFGRFAGTAENVVDLLTLVPGIDQIAKLQKVLVLSRKVFSARTAINKAGSLASPWLGKLLPEPVQDTGLVRTSEGAATLQLRVHADRIALAATGDVGAAVRAILKVSHPPAAAELHRGLPVVFEEEATAIPAQDVLRIAALVSYAAVGGGQDAD